MLMTTRPLVVWIKRMLDTYPRWLCRREFGRQHFSRFNERPVEYAFVFRQLAQNYPRKVLDVGTGTTGLPHLMRTCGFLVTATDNIRDYWPAGMSNRHYHVLNDDITNTRLVEKFDCVTCVSVLEHIENVDAAMRNMISLLNPNGLLLLTFPYNENSYVRNVYTLPGSSYGQDASFITQSFSRTELSRWIRNSDAMIIEQEYWQFWEGDHWTVGRQVIPPRKVSAGEKHQLSCVLIHRRAGAPPGVGCH